MSDPIAFVPVVGTEEEIFSGLPHEGYVYFSLDTKKIYYGSAATSSFIPMGGNSGVYYGKKEIEEDSGTIEFSDLIDLEREPDNDKLFSLNLKDLILNIPNGSFYRVISYEKIDDDIIYIAEKVTISGGGGGGGSGISANGTITVKLGTMTNTNVMVGTEAPFYLPFSFSAKYADGTDIDESSSSATVTIMRLGTSNTTLGYNGIEGVNQLTFRDVSIGSHSYDISSICKNISSKEEQFFRIRVSMFTGGEKESVQFLSVKLNLIPASGSWAELIEKENHTLIHSTQDNLKITYQLGGTGLYNFIKFYINNECIYTGKKFLNDGSYINFQETIESSLFARYNFSHGIYSIKLEIYASTSNEIEFNSAKDICIATVSGTGLFFDVNNGDYLLNTSLTDLNFTQYDLIQIPIILYGFDNTEGVSLIFTDNEGKSTTIEGVKNATWQYFSYTPKITGEVTLNFAIVGSNDLNLVCNIASLDLGELGTAVSDNLVFDFQAKNFTNTVALKNWEFLINSELKKLTFSNNFDFNNGGIKVEELADSSLQSYCLIKNGTYIEFPYKLFAPITGNTVNKTGRHFKIIFKATYCENYHAPLGGFGTKEDANYIIFDAQQCSYKIGGTTGTVKYIENELIELEIEIDGNDQTTHPYISTWINGTPYSVDIRPNDNLTFDKVLRLGSEQCDLQIYLIKEYTKSLKDIEHLRNFIADSLTSNEMKKRYNRNNVLQEGSMDLRDISIKKLIEANPECIVHTYKIDHLPTTKIKKDNATSKCIYKQYRKDYSDLSTPYVWHNDCKIGVQGTSSLNYVISGANLDTNFAYDESTDKLFHYGRRDANNNYVTINEDGSDITTEGYQLSENSIPCTYFNTKVNVASAENINNALLQEEYQLYTPYKSPVRKMNETNPPHIGKYRDTIEFTNGLLFLIDKNLEFPEEGENSESGKYKNVFCEYANYKNRLQNGQPLTPQFYAICNVGNSKNNTQVFHRSDEMCVEVKDNPYIYTQMLEKLPEGSTEASAEKYFEFRYKPKLTNQFKNENNLSLIKEPFDYWLDFLNWMVENNPAGATNNDLPIEERGIQFEPFSFSEKSPWLKEVLGDGFTVNAFVGPHYKDDVNYRMGKMLSECENHLAMDSLVYHYLFTERHTMIDNIVKNTFWSSSVDSKYTIWDLSKDYDNDTADGNDNNGKLTIDYGYEGMDTRLAGMTDLADDAEEEGAIETNTLFNGAQYCSWYNFIHRLIPYLAAGSEKDITPYSNLATNDKWGINGDKYLKKCKQWQDMIPEICWILDAYRKYKRPYEIYNDDSYLRRLEGGKKTFQRAAFETYQCNYLNSKYLSNKGTGITTRLQLERNQPIAIPIKYYSKGYLRSLIGTESQPAQRITNLNQFYYLTIPTDTTYGPEIVFNLYYPQLFSELGQNNEYGLVRVDDQYKEASLEEFNNSEIMKYSNTLSSLNALSWDFSSATKLTKLILGNNYDIKYGNKSYKTSNINFSPNSLLKILLVKNFEPNTLYSNGNVDNIVIGLNSLTRLKQLDLTNTKCNSIVLADNAPVETLILNNPQYLTLTNLYKLSNITYSDSINKISNLVSLTLNNVDNINSLSYKLLEDAISLQSYELQNIFWDLNIDNIYFRDNPDCQTITDQFIYILDELLNEHETKYSYIKEGSPIEPTELLSGVLRIGADLYNNSNSLFLYNKYILGDSLEWDGNKYFKNLKLDFLGENSQLYNFYIYNGDDSILWEKQFQNLSNITETFFNKGKKLNGLKSYSYDEIQKNATLEKVFSKNNRWTIKLNGIIVAENILIDNLKTYDFMVYNEYQIGDIECIPQFDETDRLFNIDIVTQDNNNRILHTESLKLKYHTNLEEIIDSIRWIPYRINSADDIYTVWKWTGLSSVNNGTPLSNYTIISDKTFYPTFEKISDIRKSDWEMDKKYFVFNPYISSEVSIKPNNNYILNGKIVIPSKDLENHTVCAIDSFRKNESIQHNISHILFNQNFKLKLESIASQAFMNLSTLEYFDFNHFTSGINSIGQSAFHNVNNLKNNIFHCNFDQLSQDCFRKAFNSSITSLTFSNISVFALRSFYENSTITELTWTAFNLEQWINNRNSYRNFQVFAVSSTEVSNVTRLEITLTQDTKNLLNNGSYSQSTFQSDLRSIFSLNTGITYEIK